MSLVFLNRNQETIKFVSKARNIFENIQTKEITKDKTELMYNVLNSTVKYDKELLDAYYFGVKESDGSFALFRITSSSDQDDKLSFVGPHFAADELDGYTIKDIRPKNETIVSIANRLLEGTEWRVGYVEDGLKRISGSFYYVSVKEALKQLQGYGCEIVFKSKVTSEGITDKWIEIYRQIGKESNVRFAYGQKALSVVREESRSELYTSVIGRGRGEEVGDGYGRRIEFDSVEWSRAKGNPLDKPKGQIFLEIPDMTRLYGIPMKNGNMRKRETVKIFEDIEDPEELLKATYEYLLECSRPLIQFRTTVLGGDDIGNIVTVHHHERGYHYKTRIFKVVIDYRNKRVQADLGDNLTRSATRQTADMRRGIETLDEKKMTFYQSTEVSKYQSDIIRGAGEEGGSVFIMSPSDLGTGESRAPFQTVWMNGDNVNVSDKFLVANNRGIGFIDGDFNMDNFKSAWTIDGVLNLGDGMLVLYTEERGRMMETTSRGMEFFRGDDPIGIIGTIGKNFSWIADKEDFDKALAIKLDGGEFIMIANDEEDGIYIPSKKNMENVTAAPLTISCIKGIDIISDHMKSALSVDAKGVTITKDLKVLGSISSANWGTGGGGSGSWNGQYPSEITTQADKYAWILWTMLLSFGYSKAATAGILGNASRETGGTMNPDTDQVSGPAYGIVQWDGSAFPLIPPPTYNGREYVQRLMNAAGIKEDYRTMVAQAKLINWSMFNGQWIGAVNPTTVEGFKAETDVYTATYAFLKNYERAGVEELGQRVAAANDFYNRFKDLKQPGGKYVLPVKVGTPVTSWFGPRWGTMHNGMDFGGAMGDPIFAAQSGEVVLSLPTSASGGLGEYIVIKHDDGYYTGYGHNSERLVFVGTKVAAGQQIARMGSTGDSTGPHCHFSVSTELWSGYVDPAPFLGMTNPNG